MLVIAILGVVLNGWLLIAMVRYKSTFFISKGAYLVANVAISDLINSLNSSMLGLKHTFQFPEALTTSDIVNFLDQFIGVLFHDFRHVFGALHRYRVPLQSPSLVVQYTDHQERCRSVVHRGPVRRVRSRLRQRYRLVLPHVYLWNHNSRHIAPLLQDRHQAEAAEDVSDVLAAARHQGYPRHRGPFSAITSWWRSWSPSRSSLLCRTWSPRTFSSPDICSQRTSTTRIYNFSLITILAVSIHEFCGQPDRLRVALALLSFSYKQYTSSIYQLKNFRRYLVIVNSKIATC